MAGLIDAIRNSAEAIRQQMAEAARARAQESASRSTTNAVTESATQRAEVLNRTVVADFQTADSPATSLFSFAGHHGVRIGPIAQTPIPARIPDEGGVQQPRPEVQEAVDSVIAPEASQTQRELGYRTVEAYVDRVGGIGDAGIISEALPWRSVGLLQEQGIPTVVAEPEAEAARILEVGDRRGRDDYDARLTELARTLHEAAPNDYYRERLIAEIMRQDPGALASWLEPSRANDLYRDGEISRAQRAVLAETFAAGYNGNHFPTEVRPADPANVAHDWRENPEHNVRASALDDLIYEYAGRGYDQRADRAEQVGELLDFIGSSSGPEAAEFRERYARHLIETYVVDDNVQLSQSNVAREAAAGIAAQLIGGDPARPEIAVDVLSRLTPEQRTAFYDYTADAKNLFHADELLGDLRYDEARAQELSRPDSLAVVIDAVARAEGPNAERLAVEIARLPQNQGAWFEDGHDGRGFTNYGYEERLDAMTDLFVNHSEPILDALTTYDRRGATSTSDTGLQQYHVNARDLGALFNLVLLNPNASGAAAVRGEILDYAASLTEQINAIDPNTDPGSRYDDLVGRLSMLSAATSDAIALGYAELRDDRAARVELLGFAVDLALAAIPLGNRVAGEVKNAIADLIAEGPVREAVQSVMTHAIDQGQTRLTAAAKAQLAEALGEDEAALVEQQHAQDLLEEAFVAGLGGGQRTDVVERADRLTDDLAERR